MSRHERDHEREEATDAAAVGPHRVLSAPERLAAAVGNRAFGQVVGRLSGDGLLPGGAVHPDVEATIARTRGSGLPLDSATRERVGAQLGDPLSDVTVHADATSDALARSVSARAFATGSDVYFAAGEYAPGTTGGDRTLSHELAHVVQQRGAPESGPMTVTEPGDAFETDADAVADELGG